MRQRPLRARAMCLVAALAVAGCADATKIRTDPPGAAVYVRDKFVCLTPCTYTAPRSEFSDATPIRIEKDGYEPINDTLRTGVLAGRVVGGIFTLGIVPLFKRPHTYHSLHEYALTPNPQAVARVDALAPPQPSAPLAAPPAATDGDAAIRSRLTELKSLYDRGLISRDEYERARIRVLGEL